MEVIATRELDAEIAVREGPETEFVAHAPPAQVSRRLQSRQQDYPE